MSDNNNQKQIKKGVTIKTLKYLFADAWKFDKIYFILSAVKVVVGAVLPFVDIFLLPMLLNALIAPEKDIAAIITYAALMVGLDAVFELVYSQLTIHLEKWEDVFFNHMDEEIAQKCMDMDFALMEDKKALEQIRLAREGRDYSGGVHWISKYFFSIIENVIKAVGTITVIVVYAPWLLLIIGILLAIAAIFDAKKNKVDLKYFLEVAKVDRVWDYIMWELEDFRFGKDVRIYGAAHTLIVKSGQQIDRIINFTDKWEKEKFGWQSLESIVFALRDFGTYLYLGALAILGKISIGTFSQLTTAGGTLHTSVQNIIMGFQQVIKRCNYGYEVVKLMEYPPYLEKGNRKVENLNFPHEVEFKNVSFSYPNTNVKVLNNVSIKLKAGERLSVVGLNGAGKTTFIKLLCRLYDVNEGEILLDGVNIREYDYEEYMKIFSVVFQDFKLLSFTAAENITLGKEDTPENIDAMFKKVDMLDKVNSLPKGRDTPIFKQFDKDGVQLSGGQQQKMAIARALYKNAPIVILDEPTAALDPVAEYEIYRNFNDLVGNKTAVYISHRLSSCKFCDRIAVFSEGTIKELGTHEELVHKPDGIYAEMFTAQAQYYI